MIVYSLGFIVFIGLYVWIAWICGLRDSHRSLVLAQNQYLEALKQHQINEDNRFLSALERG